MSDAVAEIMVHLAVITAHPVVRRAEQCPRRLPVTTDHQCTLDPLQAPLPHVASLVREFGNSDNPFRTSRHSG
jgi:hypothetical protein